MIIQLYWFLVTVMSMNWIKYVIQKRERHLAESSDRIWRNNIIYSASHSRVAPENVGLQKEQKYDTFACHTCMKCPPWASIHNEHNVACFWKQASTSHLYSRPTERNKSSGKQVAQLSLSVFIILSYLILSFRVANFLYVNYQNTQLHFVTGMTCKCIALLFFL
jgi:hypothetical protein